MKKKVFTILTGILFLTHANAQNTVYVNRDSILVSVQEYTIKLNSIEKMKEAYALEIKESNNNLTQKFNDLLSSYNIQQNEDVNSIKSRMKSSDTIRLNILLNEEKSLNAKEKSYHDLLVSEYQKDVQPILNKIDNAISNYAIKNKIDFIYDINTMSPALVYVNRKKNVTKQIIAEVKNIK